MSHKYFKEYLEAIKAESQQKQVDQELMYQNMMTESQQKQMEQELMYQNMIAKGKRNQEDRKLKMGLYDFPQTTDILKDTEQVEKSHRTR